MEYLLLTAAPMTLSEILTKALLNTCLGMGTVFIVLIGISFLISGLKYVPMLVEKLGSKKKKAQPVPAPAPLPVPAAPAAVEEAEEEVDDLELVAVITAAIAATLGTGTDGFVVRSIKRAQNRKW